MAFFRKKKPRKISADAKPQNPNWVKDRSGSYFRLLDLDPEEQGLTATSGIYVIWHAGVRPAYVFIGRSKNLAGALHDLASNKDVMAYEARGGLFVTWSLTHSAYQDGVVAYLTEQLMPLVDNPAVKNVDPVPVLAPNRT